LLRERAVATAGRPVPRNIVARTRGLCHTFPAHLSRRAFTGRLVVRCTNGRADAATVIRDQLGSRTSSRPPARTLFDDGTGREGPAGAGRRLRSPPDPSSGRYTPPRKGECLANWRGRAGNARYRHRSLVSLVRCVKPEGRQRLRGSPDQKGGFGYRSSSTCPRTRRGSADCLWHQPGTAVNRRKKSNPRNPGTCKMPEDEYLPLPKSTASCAFRASSNLFVGCPSSIWKKNFSALPSRLGCRSACGHPFPVRRARGFCSGRRTGGRTCPGGPS
jgi:hypothetical protein